MSARIIFYETSRPGVGGAPVKRKSEKLGDFAATATETLRQITEIGCHRSRACRGRERMRYQWHGREWEALRPLVRAVGRVTSGVDPTVDTVQNLDQPNHGES